jgi:hypothetical protein
MSGFTAAPRRGRNPGRALFACGPGQPYQSQSDNYGVSAATRPQQRLCPCSTLGSWSAGRDPHVLNSNRARAQWRRGGRGDINPASSTTAARFRGWRPKYRRRPWAERGRAVPRCAREP